MKILSIGNSFSQDAHMWLHDIAARNGYDINTTNLFIGGCSLETHWNNVLEDSEAYDMLGNRDAFIKKISIKEALETEKYDIITLQQVSGLSGMYETYEPYLSSLAAMVRESQPDAKIYFHQTWAYETDSGHGSFVNYNNNQTEMYRRIKETSETAAKSINAELIPSGEVIQTLRETLPEFDYKNGGLSLCRDGFHLTWDYGRFAAAATWFRTITGKKIVLTDFEDFDPILLKKIIDVVNK